MKALVIGRGSAGKRHASVLGGMGHDVTMCSSSDIRLDANIGYVVVASLTPNHITCLRKLREAGYIGKVLVEKPLFMNASEAEDFPFPIYVGYQLRFHPVIRALKTALEGAIVYSAHIYAGQHISMWGGTYHGDKSKGGGLLRDYSHEFDLINWLFGNIDIQDILAPPMIGNVVALVLKADLCPVISLQFNYLDKTPRREWIVNTDRGSFRVDLIHYTLQLDGEFTDFIPTHPDGATQLMHETVLSDGKDACTYAEGLKINQLIDGIEA